MLIITRYYTREFLKIFALCLASFVVLYLLVDLFENLDSFIKNKASLSCRYPLFFIQHTADYLSNMSAGDAPVHVYHHRAVCAL